MTDPSLLDRLVQFIANHYGPDEFKRLCAALDVNTGVWAEIDASKRALSLVYACCDHHCLADLLRCLQQEHRTEFEAAEFAVAPRTIALIEGQAIGRALCRRR